MGDSVVNSTLMCMRLAWKSITVNKIITILKVLDELMRSIQMLSTIIHCLKCSCNCKEINPRRKFWLTRPVIWKLPCLCLVYQIQLKRSTSLTAPLIGQMHTRDLILANQRGSSGDNKVFSLLFKSSYRLPSSMLTFLLYLIKAISLRTESGTSPFAERPHPMHTSLELKGNSYF